MGHLQNPTLPQWITSSFLIICHDSMSKVYEAFAAIEDEDLKEVMIEALEACGNYGSDVAFEISPRNVAVKDGKLILLDCFFMKSKLNQVRSK